MMFILVQGCPYLVFSELLLLSLWCKSEKEKTFFFFLKKFFYKDGVKTKVLLP